MAVTTSATRLEAGHRVFSRILVGVDGSQQALEAARQAALLEDVDGQLTLLAAWEIAPAIIGGTGSGVPYYFDEELQRTTAERALAAATDYVAPYTAAIGKLVRGTPVHELLKDIARCEDTLIAVGSSGIGRLLGIVEGEVATELVHRAPCSVLVARAADTEFPRRLVVGVDGSIESAAAYASAHYLSERFGAELRALVAWGGKGVNEHLAAVITDGEHEDSGDPPVSGAGYRGRVGRSGRRRQPRPARRPSARLGLRTRRAQRRLLDADRARASVAARRRRARKSDVTSEPSDQREGQ